MILRIGMVTPLSHVLRVVILAITALMLFESNAVAGELPLLEETSGSSSQTGPMRPVESRRYQPTVESPRVVEEISNTLLQTQAASVEEANIPILHLDLPAPSMVAERMASKLSGGPQKVGFNRRVADFLEQSLVISRSWQWQTLPNGERVTRVQVASPGASALRVGVRVRGLPLQGELRFFSGQAGQGRAYRIRAKDVLQIVERNRNAGERAGSDPDVYWSPTLEGDKAVVEIRLESQADSSKVDLEIDTVSHLVVDPKQSSILLPYAASSCELDVNCYSTINGKGSDISNAVARMIYVTAEGAFVCTGTLLADRADSKTPFFLTAHHCISTAAEASSLETTWFYESSACNSNTQSTNTQTRTGGATLLETYTNNDMTLLRLNEQPPAGVVYAGWFSDTVGEQYTAIHHPSGDWKKISFGTEQGLFSCSTSSADGVFCTPNSTGPYLRYFIDKGFSEPGSSGSGIFKDNTYLVGTLTAGSGVCNNAFSVYGRFQVGYDNGINKWLESNKVGNLENPQPSSYQSGITVISGWACIPGSNQGNPEIGQVTIEIDGNTTMQASYGTAREDTRSTCGDDNNGFGLLLNTNRLGAGLHTIRALADGQEIGRASFTVTTLGVEYLRDVSAAYGVPSFPTANQKVVIRWQENLQNFVISSRATIASQSLMAPLVATDAVPELQRLAIDPVATAPTPQASSALLGHLENPQPASYLSGITVFSGWACQPGTEIKRVDVEIDGSPLQASYGTERLDTVGVCGDTNNGWGLLFNVNRLGDGQHTARALVDGSELGRADFTVTTLGAEYLQGVSGTYRLMDFPKSGDSVVVTWQENLQNFVIKEANVR